MNTKQKLTLGIAAIFMVTLTIVGVTYAYFVTRVTGDTTDKEVNVKTATVGSVVYKPGNKVGEVADTITLEKVLPGKVFYKTFEVDNESTDAGAIATFDIFMTSAATQDKAQFVHATATTDCYTSTAKPANSKNGEDSDATTTCFDAAVYNNVKATLYEITADQFATFGTFANDGTAIADEATLLTADNKLYGETGVASHTGLTVSTVSTDLKTNIEIASGAKKYYVLKVNYENVEGNQNIENEAALTLKLSIK